MYLASMRYASFWQRFGAAIVDGLVLVPLTFVMSLFSITSSVAAVYMVVPLSLLQWAYCFFLHAFYGQTIGKRVMNIHVVNLDGTRISKITAFRRGVVDLIFACLTVFSVFWSFTQSTPDAYHAIQAQRTHEVMHESTTPERPPEKVFKSQQLFVTTKMSAISRFFNLLAKIWAWAEVITVLFNAKRRAIHDFIAGTCVVHRPTVFGM